MCAKLKYRFGDELLPDGRGMQGGGLMQEGCASKSVHKLMSAGMRKYFNWQKAWGAAGGGWVKLTVDCLGSQTDQKLNSCLTFHSKNWILHLAKKFAVRRISSSSSSGSRRKFFSFTTNLSNFRDLRCTFCSSRSSPRVLGSLSARLSLAWLHPVLQAPPPPANKTKAQWFLIMGVTSTITTTKRHCHCQQRAIAQSRLWPNAETNPLVNLLIACGFRFNCDRSFAANWQHIKNPAISCKGIPEKTREKQKKKRTF